MVGTLVGAIVIVFLTACFPQQRLLFMVGLALWGGACAFASTLLRNFASYSAALAGFTAAVIASDQLGAVGGLNGAAFTLAITRASEICIGIICAGLVLAGTDLGSARRRLATVFDGLLRDLVTPFLKTLIEATTETKETQALRRELLRRTIALESTMDEAIGESADLRYHSPLLQCGVDGLFSVLAAWRSVTEHLTRLGEGSRQEEARVVLGHVPSPLLRELRDGIWREAPARLRTDFAVAAHDLGRLETDSPSVLLLSSQVGRAFSGISHILNSLALITNDSTQPVNRRLQFRVADFLPSLINGLRAFLTILVMAIFWIESAWPNGATAITWSAIVVIVFAARADQAYSSASAYVVGNCLAAALTGILLFFVVPQAQTFFGLSVIMGLYLVPCGALMTRPRQRFVFLAMTANFIPFLMPANQTSYDISLYCNNALALITGNVVAALSFRLLPPLSPMLRTRRLLALTLRDLRRLTMGRVPQTSLDWRGRLYARLAALPEQAEPLQRAQLLAALSVGDEFIRLRQLLLNRGFDSKCDTAMIAMKKGSSGAARISLHQLSDQIASRIPQDPNEAAVFLQARAGILALSDILAEHAVYFDSGVLA